MQKFGRMQLWGRVCARSDNCPCVQACIGCKRHAPGVLYARAVPFASLRVSLQFYSLLHPRFRQQPPRGKMSRARELNPKRAGPWVWGFRAAITLSFVATMLPVAAAGTCVEGCNFGYCTCYTPFFTCDSKGGTCVGPVCDGACTMAGWLIALIVVGCVLVCAGSIACCCGRSIRECLWGAPANVNQSVNIVSERRPSNSARSGEDWGSGSRARVQMSNVPRKSPEPVGLAGMAGAAVICNPLKQPAVAAADDNPGTPPPAAAVPAPVGQFCVCCGQRVPAAGARFCPHCGASRA